MADKAYVIDIIKEQPSPETGDLLPRVVQRIVVTGVDGHEDADKVKAQICAWCLYNNVSTWDPKNLGTVMEETYVSGYLPLVRADA